MAATYATIADFESAAMPLSALGSVSKVDVLRQLERDSAFAATYLGDRYTAPVSAPYDPALTDAVCRIAAWHLLCRRGFNPENAGDQVVRQGFLDAKEWLTRVANGQARLQVSQASPQSLQPDISTGEQRGYPTSPEVGGGFGGWSF